MLPAVHSSCSCGESSPIEVPLHNVLSRGSAQATTCRRTPTLTVVDTFASQGLSTKLSTSSLREQPNVSRTLHLLLPPTLRTLVRWRTPQMLQAMRPDSTPENLRAVVCKQRHAGCDDSVRFSRRHLMRMGHQGSQQPNFGHGSGDCWKRSATVTQGDGSKVRTDRDDGDARSVMVTGLWVPLVHTRVSPTLALVVACAQLS